VYSAVFNTIRRFSAQGWQIRKIGLPMLLGKKNQLLKLPIAQIFCFAAIIKLNN
jgi:hypothetical protein